MSGNTPTPAWAQRHKDAWKQYDVITRTLSTHKWSHSDFVGEFCKCGYNGDHQNHLTLCIIRAIDKAEASA